MNRLDRRSFLTAAAAGPLAGAAEPKPMPRMQVGRYSLSRLVCGSNTFGGGSHLSVFFNRQLKKYFTPDQIRKTLLRCQEEGVNCWQSGAGGNLELYKRFTAEGLKMNYIAIDAGGEASIRSLKEGGCIAIAHHGEYTDRMFKSGHIDDMRDYLKRVRDAGLLVGVSTHMPAVVDTIESKNWDVDYYMTCVYERHRTAAELKALLGYVPLPVGEVYLQEDPPRMYRMIRQTKRPCLAFKILAAGRMSDRPGLAEAAFRETFAAIKPGDGVIVGMYDEYSDQVAENAAWVRRYGAAG